MKNLKKYKEGKKVRNNKDSQDDINMVQLKQAFAEWKASQNYFENVTDPELIDYAIYDMEAARRKYFYLVKKNKENSFT